MENNKENLSELLRHFYDSQKASEVEQDILKGEELFIGSPAPEPSEAVRDDIKRKVGYALFVKRAHQRRMKVYSAVMSAAAVIIVMLASIVLFENYSTKLNRTFESVPVTFWSAESHVVSDMAVYGDEIEDAQNKLTTIQSGEKRTNGSEKLDELETKYIELCSDFWKG